MPMLPPISTTKHRIWAWSPVSVPPFGRRCRLFVARTMAAANSRWSRAPMAVERFVP